jgi:PleD family two-component response regulator
MGMAEAQAVCERIRIAITEIDCRDFAEGLSLSASIGLAGSTDCSHHEKLVSRADAHLYQAKRGGRNQVVSG